jgi:hypothetical protein
MLDRIATGLGDFGFEAAMLTLSPTAEDPSPSAIACRVMMEYGTQDSGDVATVFGPRILATFLLAEVSPAAGALLVLAKPHRTYGDSFRLDAPDLSWQSQADSRWVVLNGAT